LLKLSPQRGVLRRELLDPGFERSELREELSDEGQERLLAQVSEFFDRWHNAALWSGGSHFTGGDR
jgi:hypothetical protein